MIACGGGGSLDQRENMESLQRDGLARVKAGVTTNNDPRRIMTGGHYST